MPVSIAAQGGRSSTSRTIPRRPTPCWRPSATRSSIDLREPHRESVSDVRSGNGTSIHGTEATLVVNRSGCSIYPNAEGRPSVRERPGMGAMNVPHWKNFIECIRTRQKPISDIETCVRSTVSCVLGNLSMRHESARLGREGMDREAGGIRPHLKALTARRGSSKSRILKWGGRPRPRRTPWSGC